MEIAPARDKERSMEMTELPTTSAPVIKTDILCQQCSAVLPVELGNNVAICAYCATTNLVDTSQFILHYMARPTLRENDAEAVLRRWMAGSTTVEGLDKLVKIERPLYQLFPMWMIRTVQADAERLLLEPAAALSVSELKRMRLASVDLERYDDSLAADAVAATVPYTAMMRWLADDYQVKREQVREVALVHLPVYLFKYHFAGQRYTAAVAGATGEVFASVYPAKRDMPYHLVAGASLLIYFALSLGLALLYTNGGISFSLCLSTYLAVAVPATLVLFGAAGYVASSV
jgi:hypothetical protein